jgi:predicted lipid-binding transport protein (Tim44 family)
MSGDFQWLDIVLFAAIAGFLLFRLRSVLGRRTGNERRRIPPFAAPPAVAPGAPPSRPRLAAAAGAELGDPAVAQLAGADPGFDSDAFLVGARGAFEIIVHAFAAGDRAALQPLLSPEVFKSFSDAIEARERAKEKQETTIHAIKSADLTENKVVRGTALVTVKFVSEQTMVTRGIDGAVIEGDPDHPAEQTDFWTFSRQLRARDPNWILVATHAPEE